MNSSTSNSNHSLNESEGSNTMTSRKIFLKITLAITLGMGLSVVILRGFLELNEANKEGILGRVIQAQNALPEIVKEPQELVMFFGSSMTRAGFSARIFDRNVNAMGNNIKSFNFGFGGLNPYFQDFLSRRIAESFIDNDRRLKLALIEFNPFQPTQARWKRAKSTVDSFLTMLATDRELFDIAKTDITRGIRLFTIKYIRNDISAEMITSYYGREMFPSTITEVFKDDEETIAAARKIGAELSELFEKEYPEFRGEEWYYPWQGAGTIPEERSEHTLQLFSDYYKVTQTEAVMKNDRLGRIRSADIEDMHFEPLLIESFIQIVKNFQQFSDKVEVVMLPRNTRWIHYSDEGKARLAEAIKQIEKATGVTVVSHQALKEVKPEMFRDSTHLARYTGDIAYTNFLVKQYAKDL